MLLHYVLDILSGPKRPPKHRYQLQYEALAADERVNPHHKTISPATLARELKPYDVSLKALEGSLWEQVEAGYHSCIQRGDYLDVPHGNDAEERKGNMQTTLQQLEARAGKSYIGHFHIQVSTTWNSSAVLVVTPQSNPEVFETLREIKRVQGEAWNAASAFVSRQ